MKKREVFTDCGRQGTSRRSKVQVTFTTSDIVLCCVYSCLQMVDRFGALMSTDVYIHWIQGYSNKEISGVLVETGELSNGGKMSRTVV